MKMGASCKTLHIKSAWHSPRIYVIPVVTSQIGKQTEVAAQLDAIATNDDGYEKMS